ncbi:hypothetical protein GC197_00045 [bacterium]|nr:hypothetical protein [bacterium]
MEIPLQIRFRNMEPSQEIEGEIRDNVEKLEELFGEIVGCRVVVLVLHQNDQRERAYEMRILTMLPHDEFVVDRESGFDRTYDNIHDAIRNAFDYALQQLEDYALEICDPKHALGRIVHHCNRFGFLGNSDCENVYCHANSLTIGDRVHFVQVDGAKETQAMSVNLLRRFQTDVAS